MNAVRQQPTRKPLMARTVARALTRYLEDCNTTIHWVNVVGEDSLARVAEKLWPDNDPLLNVMLCQGFSEGMLVYVMAQANRYKPAELTPLLQIKMLGGRSRVASELPCIMEFLDKIETYLPQGEISKQNEAVGAIL